MIPMNDAMMEEIEQQRIRPEILALVSGERYAGNYPAPNFDITFPAVRPWEQEVLDELLRARAWKILQVIAANLHSNTRLDEGLNPRNLTSADTKLLTEMSDAFIRYVSSGSA
jgi:hypothetical protein